MPPRRIQPELIAAPGQVTTQQAFLTAAEVHPAEALADGAFPLQLDFRQQAAMARKVLGPGRMLCVDLEEMGHEVDWRKLLKAAGALRLAKPLGAEQNGGASDPGGPPPLLRFPEPQGGGGGNALAQALQRIEDRERRRMMQGPQDNGESDSDGDDDNSNGGGSDTETSKGAKVRQNEAYDYDDEFIDDAEIMEMYEGDRRKPKQTGFYINEGEVEKTEELIDPPEAPKHRRRPKEAAKPAAEINERKRQVPEEDEEALEDDQPVKKKRKPDKPVWQAPGPATHQPTDSPSPAAAASQRPPSAGVTGTTSVAAIAAMMGSMASADPAAVQPAQPAEQQQPVSLAALRPMSAAGLGAEGAAPGSPPARTPATVRKGSGSADAAAQPYIMSEDIEDLLEQLQKLASTVPHPPAAGAEAGGKDKSRTVRRLPDEFVPLLTELARLIERAREQQGARAQIVNAAFQILEPWSTKSNLSTRIKTLYEKTDDFKVAMEEQLQAKREAFLQDVHASLQRSQAHPLAEDAVGSSGDDFADAGGSESKPATLKWSQALEDRLVEYVDVAKAGNSAAEWGKCWHNLTEAWPAGVLLCTHEDLSAACQRGKQRQTTRQEAGKKKRGPQKPRRPKMDSGQEAAEQGFVLPTPGVSPVKDTQPPSQVQHDEQLDVGSMAAPRPARAPSQVPDRPGSNSVGPMAPGAGLRGPAGGSPGFPAKSAAFQKAAIAAAAAALRPSTEVMPPPGSETGGGGVGTAGQQPTSAAVAGPAQTMGVRPCEEDLMQTAQGHRANIQEVLLAWPDRKAGTPREAVFVALLHAGPSGLNAKDIIRRSQELGVHDWGWRDEEAVSSNLTKRVLALLKEPELPYCYVGGYTYALKLFPGTVCKPWPKRGRDDAGAGDGVSSAAGQPSTLQANTASTQHLVHQQQQPLLQQPSALAASTPGVMLLMAKQGAQRLSDGGT